MRKTCMYCGHKGFLVRSSLHVGKWMCRNKKACNDRMGGMGKGK